MQDDEAGGERGCQSGRIQPARALSSLFRTSTTVVQVGPATVTKIDKNGTHPKMAMEESETTKSRRINHVVMQQLQQCFLGGIT